MLKLNKLFYCVGLLIGALNASYAQTCHHKLELKTLIPEKSNQKIEGFIRILENESLRYEKVVSSIKDLKDTITVSGLCDGEYHIVGFLSGFSLIDLNVDLADNKIIELNFKLTKTDLHAVEVFGDQNKLTGFAGATVLKIDAKTIQNQADKPLADILSDQGGIEVFRSGQSISKPLINGLSGTRILAIQNGIRLEGQQWASDHGFELDALPQTEIMVYRGASSLLFGSDALGGTILVAPVSLENSDAPEAQISTWFASNGRAWGQSGYFQKGIRKGKHHFQGRLNARNLRSGALKTPDYYLNNTSFHNFNSSLHLNYDYGKWGVELYSSYLYHTIGIFSGAEVGNLADLQLAITNQKPIENNFFSRNIDRANQNVWHSLNKVKVCYHFSENELVEWVYGFQQNNRREFDAGLPFNEQLVQNNTPDAYFNLLTHSNDVRYTKTIKGKTRILAGLQLLNQSNVFRGLEYRAIVPNYRMWNAGAFTAISHEYKKYTFDAGLRYDQRQLMSFISNLATANVDQFQNEFGSLSFSAGLKKTISSTLNWFMQLGSAWRQPNAYELYGNGLHQATASFDFSNPDLKTERVWSLSGGFRKQSKLTSYEVSLFSSYFDHYIYLNPLPQPVITIAGAFPAFAQQQSPALISGIDAALERKFLESYFIRTSAHFIYGYNFKIEDHLIYMPPLRIKSRIGKQIGKLQWNVTGNYVFEQFFAPENVDFAPPPPSFFILQSEISYQHKAFRFAVVGDNVTNSRYRNYLNRFRYFADEPGVNLIFKIHYNISFTNQKQKNT